MAEKITNINVEGRVYEFLSGQGVKGACTAPASSWTKPLVLPEGAVLLDGLIMAITFVNGTNVGFSGTKTIYSSDGENFYYDQAKTDPVTFPPVDNYILEHTSGEEYSFSAFPTIVYGNHTLPVRDAKGHITGGEVWNTGDTVICIFIDNMFLMLSAAVSDAVASGDMNPVTSNAVAGALNPLHIAKGGSIYADGTKANLPIIKMKDNTSDANGNGIVIGGGGVTIIGGGESADTYYSGSGLSAGAERMVVANDGAITFASNLQSNYASRKEMTMGADGKLSNPQGFVGNVTGDCSGNSATATKVVGTYTGNGGQQNPQYVGKNRVCFNMMNTSVLSDTTYKDWLLMDCYSGFDAGGSTAFGISRTQLRAYIMRANAGTSPNRPTSWAESGEVPIITTKKFNGSATNLPILGGIKLSNGLIINWGRFFPKATSGTATYLYAFTSATSYCISLASGNGNNNGSDTGGYANADGVEVKSATTAKFTITDTSRCVDFIAIGY